MSRYTLIKGSFPIVGTEPDGDTIRFKPDDPAIVERLGPAGQRPDFSAGGTQINVRFEGVDALETHFAGTHQQEALGALAAERMLAIAGFTRVERNGNKVAAAEPLAVRGHVAANSLDSYGRMIAFVFGEEHDGEDGSELFLDPPTLARSVNAALLAEGLVYPAFYTTLPVDLKDNLKAQNKLVRERAVGVWAEDAPSLDRAAELPDLAAAAELVMWPKLFRRLVSYFQGGNAGLAGFDAWLRQDARNRDDYLMLPSGEIGNMHDLVAVAGDTMRLNFRPEDLVILPDTFVPDPAHPPIPTEPIPTQPTPAPAPGGDALRIVAALVDPVGEDTGQETVTILNRSAEAVALDGWQIRDRQLQAAARPGQALAGTLAAGDTLRVLLRAPVLLGNAGDDLVLIAPGGQVAQSVTFVRPQGAKPGETIVF
jgi:endonuclease YncB( thermonuclease family)